MAIVTISRGTFSGGKEVAEKLANRLNYSCVSREMVITEAAQYFSIDESQLSDAMAEAPSILSSDRPISASNVNFVRFVLLKRIRNMDLVYHGLAGDMLLRGVKKILRVRIFAGTDYRVDAAMAAHGIDHEKAVEMIQELDTKRNKWAQVVLGVEWNDPSLYDISFNLKYMNIDSVVNVLEKLTRCEEFTPDETTTKSLEDLILSSNVWAAITQHKQSWSHLVHVMAEDGRVTVYGDVVSRKLADAICTIAGGADGVKEVVNNINVGTKWLL
ncbi:cytidylate kinase family protein [Desulforhopalus singaporensis]|uniref:Cytidylate kinase n=1 Tax=Desulforhopalus singaporensis TaxID=91360 RepID=A0A1H0VNY9_9BACT|nr:cytidylate kinase family protein [Desulforhopalus singaporensis]SDP80083.1 Cytidylate kinase [Desulforhopalus singaporensis]